MDLYSIRRQLTIGIPLTSIKLRVTDYSRVSTQNIMQKNSLKNQIEHFDEMIKTNPNWIYVKGYIDEGITGTSDIKRDNFMKMISDAKKGLFDLIITKEISRFSRNTLDSIKYTRELLQYGVAVLFVNDNINTAQPDAELRLTIMASMAQDEIRRLSERVKFGMNRAIKKGNILGNNKLFGYQKNKTTGNYIIDEKESQIIREIYDMYLIENLSLNKIAKVLKEKNLKTSSNKDFSVSTLSRIIKNPKYKGYYCGKKTEVIDYMTKKIKYFNMNNWIMYKDTNKIPPIINEEIWNKAFNKLTASTQLSHNKKKYPLSTKIICQHHNTLFYRRKISNNSNNIAWYCSKYLNEGKNNCSMPSIRQSELYSIIESITTSLNININKITSILTAIYNKDKNNNITNIYINNIEKIKQKKEKILELNISGILSNNEFKEKNNKYNNEIKELEKKISTNNNTYNQKKINSFLKKDTTKAQINNKLIEMIIDKIIVSKDNNNNINLNIVLNLSSNDIKDKKTFLSIKEFNFKRGYDKKGTKRYMIKYIVKCSINNNVE